MLTIKSRMFSANRIGTEVTAADLVELKRLITCDYSTFRGEGNAISYGFTSTVAEAIADRADTLVDKNAKICIINDLSLDMLRVLLQHGYKLENIYLAIGNWTTQKSSSVVPRKGDTTDIFQYHISKAINETINIITLEEMFDMTFDLIIANPPYGKIGAQITDTIRKEVKYNHFVNLLPANDYKRVTNLYQYVRNMEAINNGFEDAAVTTHLCEIVKESNNMTVEEFEISQYIDPQLDKYFRVLRSRTHYAIDTATYKPKLANFEEQFDLSRCLFIGKRYISDEHIPYTKNCAGYKVNMERNITSQELIALSAKSEQAHGNVGDFSLVQFNTVEEQNNITNFLYSSAGFRFFAKILIAMNIDSYCHVSKFIPKVDWARAWTVEEILADYGYTVEEATEVMESLKGIKDMERD